MRSLLEGFLVLCRAVPFISLLPLTTRLFGLTETGKFFLVAWASATVSWIVIHDRALNVPQMLVWRARSLGISTSRWVRQILIPACSEGIYSGLRASLSLGLIVVAVAEMSGVYERSTGLWWSEGLGYRLFRSLDESRDDLLLASILSFAALGIALDRAFVLAWWIFATGTFRLRQVQVRAKVVLAQTLGKAQSVEWGPPVGIEVASLDAGYNGTQVLEDLSLKIKAGETLSVVAKWMRQDNLDPRPRALHRSFIPRQREANRRRYRCPRGRCLGRGRLSGGAGIRAPYRMG